MRKEVADFYDSLIEEYQIELKDPFSEAQQYLDKIITSYYATEVYNMTTMQFEKFDTALRSMHGNLSIELDGPRDSECIAHIDVPLNYLKYFDIKMPTTDFCVRKRNDTGNWIEVLPAIKKI